jgi:hypothetical protein
MLCHALRSRRHDACTHPQDIRVARFPSFKKQTCQFLTAAEMMENPKSIVRGFDLVDVRTRYTPLP